jgi:hypothetical protein
MMPVVTFSRRVACTESLIDGNKNAAGMAPKRISRLYKKQRDRYIDPISSRYLT